ncbi:6-hydroxymethylpterin diphosphokinase MptE-like protein [Legionella longbeachae]|uniref:Putative glycosyl transferase family 2 n=1 Tax=Legionella longbeachae serogroup 1 (strain NSW150) TaxID=661367 RepID=D3HMC9_LEGLN|nr:6-hydroxymethylpterin diphosphokinase MptE-like protein [Legionella longbeachae]QIN37043.1 DUF115 domain-containing protein [Legionella longbeachae]CBJ13618.1 putative glycosyl transferase family 2 [Legionella longbeachae NSW150]HBD7396901.1 DUF115 domain-containing protein [Legionella pneumophila]
MNILIFTDSRGQHKPVGQNHKIFGERLAEHPDLNVDLYLCPMKWTTTLDFLASFSKKQLKQYDWVILYTGIVDWSPRPVSSAYQDLYNNTNTTNLDNIKLNTRDYSKKIVNNKKKIFDEYFGEEEIIAYLQNPFSTEYNNEKTINMYSLEMAENKLLPKLNELHNLIFISSNYFVKGWEGDYKKGRPKNIHLTHEYSNLFSNYLKKERIVDLRKWTDEEVMKYTCDNLHLTQAGSDYIYKEILKIMNLSDKNINSSLLNYELNTRFIPLKSPERIIGAKVKSILDKVGSPKYLATLIIGLRVRERKNERLNNLDILLDFLSYYYSDLFDILIVEQDSEPQLCLNDFSKYKNIRYEFIYNPKEFNRGWGYNVAVKHFCVESEVVVLMDTDVLPASNFIRELLDCYTKFDAISPYQNIYYSDGSEVKQIKETRQLEHLVNEKNIKNPVTIAGGILIIKRSVFLALKGFEQYISYGCEDRAFDVTLFNHIEKSKIRIAPFIYVHLYHGKSEEEKKNFKKVYQHLVDNYQCKYHPELGPYDFIHTNCKHVSKSKTLSLMLARAVTNGDPDLYKRNIALTANGLYEKNNYNIELDNNVIFPPDPISFINYKQKELYLNSPNPDSEELEVFYNAYKGERCFILGNGPSLNKHDLSLLEKEYTFGVNSLFYKTRESGFKPYFYVVEDTSVMKENINEIKNYDVPFKFFPTNYKNLHPKLPNTFFFRMNRGFYEKASPNYVVPRFSTDASNILYCGQSVTYINLQLAYFMGFTEVYLIGMDFDYIIPSSHTRTGDVLLSDTDDPNHFHKDYFGKGKTWKDPKLERVAINYKMAKLVYESVGRKIYNATIGGKLEIFERIDYDKLFIKNDKIIDSIPMSVKKDFKTANQLYKDKKYIDSFHIYLNLYKSTPDFHIYREAAVHSILKARKVGQCIPEEILAMAKDLLN